MKFIGFVAHFCNDRTYDIDEIAEFMVKNKGKDTIDLFFSRAEVTFRDGQIGLFDKDGNLIITIVPTHYPDEPYRICYPDDDYDSEGFDEDAIGRILTGFKITEG